MVFNSKPLPPPPPPPFSRTHTLKNKSSHACPAGSPARWPQLALANSVQPGRIRQHQRGYVRIASQENSLRYQHLHRVTCAHQGSQHQPTEVFAVKIVSQEKPKLTPGNLTARTASQESTRRSRLSRFAVCARLDRPPQTTQVFVVKIVYLGKLKSTRGNRTAHTASQESTLHYHL